MYLHGRNVLKEILALSRTSIKIRRVLFTDQQNVDPELKTLINQTKSKGFRVETASQKVLVNLSREKKNQGVLVELREFPYAELGLISNLPSDRPSIVVMLDSVQDPHNLGAIARTSVAAGADALIITSRASAQVTPAVVKVSAGLIFRIPVIRVVNLARAMETLKEWGYWIYGSSTQGEHYMKVPYAERSALVMGNESEGLRRLVREKCDALITIPMANGVDSMNVSAATAVLLFNLREQLTGDDGP